MTVHPDILYNYRNMYERMYNDKFIGTDNELEELIEAVGVLESSSIQDEEVIKEMRERSRKNAESIHSAIISYRD